MLRLVHPAREGQERPRPSKGRRSPALLLTAAEERHLRTTIKNTARALGGMDVLAAMTSISRATLEHVAYAKSRHPSAALALLVARAAGISLEAAIGGKLSAVGRCPSCGSRIGTRKAARHA